MTSRPADGPHGPGASKTPFPDPGGVVRELRFSKWRPTSLAYSPAGTLLAVAGQHSVVKLLDVATGREHASVQWRPQDRYHGDFTQVTFSRDGRLLAAARELDFALWRLPDLSELPIKPLTGSLNCRVAFFPDGNRLAVGWNMAWRDDIALTIWDVSQSRVDHRFGDQYAAVPALAASPAGDLIAVARKIPGSAVFANCVDYWDVAGASWRPPLELDPSGAMVVRDLSFSPDGRSIVAAAGKSASVWDVSSGQRLFRLPEQPQWVTTVSFSADGRTLATGGKDGTVRLWDVPSGRQTAVFDWQTGAVRCVAFSPDGMTAAVVGDRHKVVLWDVDG